MHLPSNNNHLTSPSPSSSSSSPHRGSALYPWSGFIMKSEPPAPSKPKEQGSTLYPWSGFLMKSEPPSPSKQKDLEINRMSDLPRKNLGHRRANSEIVTLTDEINIDRDLLGGSSFSDEDLISMYMHMDKYDPSLPPGEGSAVVPTQKEDEIKNERLIFKHPHTQSMDGSSTLVKKELMVSEGVSVLTEMTKKPMSAAELRQLALVDPKRAKRIWANRQSAARSKERKSRYIAELERKVNTLQTEATTLSVQLTLLQNDTTNMIVENTQLQLLLQNLEKQANLREALNDALKEEVQHLKLRAVEVIANNRGSLAKVRPSFGKNQQLYPFENATNTLLASQQFQQLQLQSQQFHQLQKKQQPKKQQIKKKKVKGYTFSCTQRDDSEEGKDSSSEE